MNLPDNCLIKAHLVLPSYTKRGKHYGGLTPDGYLGLENGIVTQAGSLPFDTLGDQPVTDYTGHYIIPGLIDLQVNGGGGLLFNDAATLQDLHTIIQDHKNHGTTGLLATLITDSIEQLERQLRFIAQAIETDETCRKHILGIHLEGPFFNPERRGTHPLDLLRDPDVALMQRFVDAAQGHLRIVTLAPELPGALDVIRSLVKQRILVSLGHSEADYPAVAAAVEAGATLGTHVFNAMSQLVGRDPGMVGGLLDQEGLQLGLINDGHHVHDASLRIALKTKSLNKCFFVSDAMFALSPDGEQTVDYRGERMTMRKGAVINARGRFAGSAAPLLTALQRGVSHLGLSITDAVRLCTANPAQILNRRERGSMTVGQSADLIMLKPDLSFASIL